MSFKVYITDKHNKEDMCVATCDFSDDAELIFESYKIHQYSCRVVWDNALEGKEELHCEHKETP